MVHSVAERYAARVSVHHRRDLVSAGLLGLSEALDRFNPHHGSGAKLSSYAYFWIRSHVLRAVRGAERTIQLSAARVEQMTAVLRACRELDLAPTDVEHDSALLAQVASRAQLSDKRVRRALQAYSLQERPVRFTFEMDGTFAAEVASEVTTECQQLLSSLQRALQHLPDDEAHVIELLYGLERTSGRVSMKPRKRTEAVRELGTTQWHVSRLQQQALKRLQEAMDVDLEMLYRVLQGLDSEQWELAASGKI